MSLVLTRNITFQQAVARGAPVWNFKISSFGDYTLGTSTEPEDIEFSLTKPRQSLRGVSIAQDSIAQRALVEFTPAGLPQTDLVGGNAAWTPRGSRLIVTKDQPLLIPLQAGIKIKPLFSDLYTNSFTDLAGGVQPFGNAVGSKLTAGPLLSMNLHIKGDPAWQAGPRSDDEGGFLGIVYPANGAEGIVTIYPVHGRRWAQFVFENDGPADVDLRVTGIMGFQGATGNGLREMVIPTLSNTITLGAGDNYTVAAGIACQYLVVRAESAGAAQAGRLAYSFRDVPNCCDSLNTTPIPIP